MKRNGKTTLFAIGRGTTCVAFALVLVFAVAVTQAAQGQNFHIMHSFTGADGANPWVAGVVRDSSGNLYGTTTYGGAYGLGTVFKVNASGGETVLHSFSGPDGSGPTRNVILDGFGNIYGVTQGGGTSGLGTVFMINSKGQEKVLHNFSGPDGSYPSGPLIRDAYGNLYGTTASGGADNYGTIFRLDTAANETVLYSFTGGVDGSVPTGGLVWDSTGNLYGTTNYGGTSGLGTIFKLASGGYETVLHAFNGADGQSPEGGLIRDSAGNLYGTTIWGGASGNTGTVFKLDTSNVLHSVELTVGFNPIGGVVSDTAGNLYGTTINGGSGNCYRTVYRYGQQYLIRIGCGVIFEMSTNGAQTVLYNFPGGSTGPGAANPEGSLMWDGSGNLYGTTRKGGTSGYGTVFELVP